MDGEGERPEKWVAHLLAEGALAFLKFFVIWGIICLLLWLAGSCSLDQSSLASRVVGGLWHLLAG